ncbi:MAG: ribonuclease P protein component [Saprospiraceae bacterium]
MKFTFKKTERLKSRKTIERLFTGGQSFGVYPLRLVFLKENEVKGAVPVQFTASVSKRNFKSAVVRNRLKRRIREAWRLNKHRLYQELSDAPVQYAFMVIYIAKEEMPYAAVEKAMQAMIRRFIKKNIPPNANPPEEQQPLS